MIFSQLYAKFRVWPRRRRKTQLSIVLPSQETTIETRNEEKQISWKEIKQQDQEVDYLNWPLSNDKTNDGVSKGASTRMETCEQVVTMPGSNQSYPEIEEKEPSVYGETVGMIFESVETQFQGVNNHSELTSLSNLPTELHLQIFSLLRPSESVLLGLTCKKFYNMHWNTHGSVFIATSLYSISNPRSWEMILMYHLLESWMGKDYKFDLRLGKFVKQGLPKNGMKEKKKEGKPLRRVVAIPRPPHIGSEL
ncbi:hypothetical protein BGZ60DRAFT_402582 [Tricladium varicosporioides]|nr:hypothetical protein BGZ60DRAFT_402582 [Hymenoscyphus varicosporioides]